MAKKFVRIKQTFYVDAIMDIAKGETSESIQQRVEDHLESNGGAETVIVLGGNVTTEVLKRKPTLADEDSYECID